MAVDKHIKIPFTVTGGVSTVNNGGVNTLSGYTNKLTTFVFETSSSAPVHRNPPWISNDYFVWDLGDGTRTKGISAEHIYQYPGIYTVSVIGYTSGGQEYLSTETKQLSVSNFLNDQLDLVTSDAINVFNVPANSRVNRISVSRQSSWQPHNAVSATGYTINLYASGSTSKQLNIDDYENFKWSHLDNTWSFFKPVTANNNELSYTPIQSLSTVNNEDIYYVKLSPSRHGGQYYQRVTGDYLTSVSAKDTVFVGTTGSCEFLYVDSTPKLDNDFVFAFASLDTTQFPHYAQSLYGKLDSFSLEKYFESFSLTIPIRVKINPAQSISFNSSGILSMSLSKIKYQLINVPYFVTLEGNYDSLARLYPPLNILPAVAGAAEPTDLYTVSLSTISGSDSNFTNTTLLSTHYFNETDTQLPSSLSGLYRGFFLPIDTSDNVKLAGKVILNDIPNFPKDINFGYVTNNDHGLESRILFRNNFVTNNSTGIIENSKDIKITSLTAVEGNREQLTDIRSPLAVTFVSDDLNNNKVQVYLANTKSTSISGIDTYNQPDSLHVDYRTNILQDDPLDQTIDVVADYYVGSPLFPSVSSTSVAIDEDRNYYVAIPGVSLVVKLSADNGRIADVYTSDNLTYSSVTSGTNKLSVKNGVDVVVDTTGDNNTHSPSIVETGKNGSVHIGYTNPVSGFIQKYTESDNLASEYKFNQPNIPTDMVVDNRDNLWVSVKNPIRHISGYKNEIYNTDYVNSLSALGVTGSAVKRAGNNFEFVFTTNTFFISSGEILEVTGFAGAADDTVWYNGDFLVDTVSGNATTTTVIVKPYIGVFNQAATTTGTVTNAITAIRRPSDKIYKFNTSGSLLFSVSGFINPEHVVVDNNQNLWVSDNIDTITQLNTAGDILQSLVVRDDTYVSDFVADNGPLINSISPIDGSKFDPLTAQAHHIGGISVDTYNNVLVINSFENKVYSIPSDKPTLSASFSLNNLQSPASAITGFVYGKTSAKGDWTGYRWLNKYKNTTGERVVEGETTFSVYDSGGRFTVTKVNENFNPQQNIKDSVFNPQLSENTVLFDDFLGTIVGNTSGDINSLGRVTYEKIANFVDNHNDIDTCSINSLYSLCKMYNVDINNYNLIYPGRLKRIADLVSISHSKLWGTLEVDDSDYDLTRPGSIFNPTNLGEELDVTTYVVSADQPLVAKYLFNGEVQKIITGHVSPYESSGRGSTTSPNYIAKYSALSSYPLSAFTPYWGWNIVEGISGTEIKDTIKFYEHTSGFTNELVEGVIDWNNPQTTLLRSSSSVEEWTEDDGIVDSLIDFELRKGLGLFTDTLSAYTPGVL